VAGLTIHCQSQGGLPDHNCTPGAVNGAVTQSNIQSTICRSGYTKTIRPPSNYTTSLKVQQITMYGYADTKSADYEEDHLISLELGGNPTDPHNLWPEPYNIQDGARLKDQVENYLHRQVCGGAMTLAAAQRGIAENWRQYLPAIGH
jgi:hypothetical protein